MLFLLESDLKIYTNFLIYAITFSLMRLGTEKNVIVIGLMQFGIDETWPHLSCVAG